MATMVETSSDLAGRIISPLSVAICPLSFSLVTSSSLLVVGPFTFGPSFLVIPACLSMPNLAHCTYTEDEEPRAKNQGQRQGTKDNGLRTSFLAPFHFRIRAADAATTQLRRPSHHR